MFGKCPNRIVVFCSALANDPKQRITAIITAIIFFIRDLGDRPRLYESKGTSTVAG
jgi:hypothetical protein